MQYRGTDAPSEVSFDSLEFIIKPLFHDFPKLIGSGDRCAKYITPQMTTRSLTTSTTFCPAVRCPATAPRQEVLRREAQQDPEVTETAGKETR